MFLFCKKAAGIKMANCNSCWHTFELLFIVIKRAVNFYHLFFKSDCIWVAVQINQFSRWLHTFVLCVLYMNTVYDRYVFKIFDDSIYKWEVGFLPRVIEGRNTNNSTTIDVTEMCSNIVKVDQIDCVENFNFIMT